MNILFLPSYYPDDLHPAYGIFIKRHAQAIGIKHSVAVIYVYALSWKDFFRTGKHFTNERMEQGVRTIRFALPALPPLTPLLRFIITLLIFSGIRRNWKIDIIHSHIVLPAGLTGHILGKLFRIPVMLTEHTGPFSNHMISPVRRFLIKKVMENAGMVSTVSQSLQKQIERFGIRARFCVIPNAVDTRVYKLGKRKSKKQGEPIGILTVSALLPEKGVDYLIEAAGFLNKKRKRFVLSIAGDGPERKRCEGLVRQYGLEEKVRFFGMVDSQETLIRMMQEADFYVSPSLGETFGVVLIEAMACGKPVVATDSGGPGEFLNKENGLLVKPGNAKALAEGLEQMMARYKKYSAERIRRFVLEHFAMEKVSRAFDFVYQGLKQNEP